MSWKRPDVMTRMKVFLSSLPDHFDGYMIDMGTGDGIFAQILAEKYQNQHIFKSDIRKRYYKDLILHSITNPPFRSRSYDLIVVGQVLHYIPSQKWLSTLRSLSASLADEGYVVIVEYYATRAYSWLPYPVHPNIIKDLANQIDKVNVDYLINDNDIKRPKYAIVLKRN